MKFFGIIGDRGEFRPIGRMTLAEGVQLVSLAIIHAREQKTRKLLINITGVTGIEPPTVADRYFMACEWAEAGAGAVRVVMVAHREMIDAEKFGMTVATNRGLSANIFSREDEALAWLEQGD